ncbi:hypothetical protein BJ878DRAFT_90796 [Calycina marina]|uniref:DEAD/DEAH box helicase domain-containing protein n=1 Tax=Calycina marina TaxID=1763456 RepID=A0A9P8CJ67_9HELO|nr:hypothetical protein BJ878DRAFT_90796 [Calycina marina]
MLRLYFPCEAGRRETTNDTRNLVRDAEDTTSMLAIQGLVEKARYASGEVQNGIIRAGLQRHLYPFEPLVKQVDAIWLLVFKKKYLLLAAKTSFGKSVRFQAAPLFCHGGIGLIITPLDRIGQELCISKGFLARDPCLLMARRIRLIHWSKMLRWGCTLISLWVQRSQPVGFGR